MMTKFFLLGKPVIKALRGGLPRRLGRILFVAINIGFLQGCDHDAFDGIIYKPNGEIAKPEELSAGISTIFSTVSGAYDTNADWVTGELLTRFNRGAIPAELAIETQDVLLRHGSQVVPVQAFHLCWFILHAKPEDISPNMAVYYMTSPFMA